jgi:hypothetical protein
MPPKSNVLPLYYPVPYPPPTHPPIPYNLFIRFIFNFFGLKFPSLFFNIIKESGEGVKMLGSLGQMLFILCAKILSGLIFLKLIIL